MSIIAIIPARGNSRRIKNKNRKLFHGRPIIEYSIDTAHRSGLFEDVVVSTDNKEICNIAERSGATIHRRADMYARDDVGTQLVANRVLRDLDYRFGLACVIYPTAPMLDREHLVRGFSRLYLSKDLETRFCYSVDEDGNDAGQWYWGRIPAFRDAEPLIGGLTVTIAVPNVCDINVIEDWQRAEQMYGELNE